MSVNIILGITGSVAAYKAVSIINGLLAHSCDVTIVLSKSAPKFVSVLTLRSLFPGKVHVHNETIDNNDHMLHIMLAKMADLVLVAPASANTLSKLAHASADCLLSAICLATKAKILIAPAMNKIMWDNILVQKNVKMLEEAGVHIIHPTYGKQACGDVGYGRMAEPSEIIECCWHHRQDLYCAKGAQKHIMDIAMSKIFDGKKIVITAGHTIEKLDPVRFLSNFSSGKMGYAIADAARRMGADVTLITGITSLRKPRCRIVDVVNAKEMLEVALVEASDADIFVGCAAIVDYRPEVYSDNKIKKCDERIELRLIKNIDVIRSVKEAYADVFCVGFAAETENIEENGLLKLQEKHIDMIAINDVSGGKIFGEDENELCVIAKDRICHRLDRDDKTVIAFRLLKLIADQIYSEHRGNIDKKICL